MREMAVPARSAREIEIKGDAAEKTEWQEPNESWKEVEEKRNGRLVGAAGSSKELVEFRRPQQKNLNIMGLRKRKE